MDWSGIAEVIVGGTAAMRQLKRQVGRSEADERLNREFARLRHISIVSEREDAPEESTTGLDEQHRLMADISAVAELVVIGVLTPPQADGIVHDLTVAVWREAGDGWSDWEREQLAAGLRPKSTASHDCPTWDLRSGCNCPPRS